MNLAYRHGRDSYIEGRNASANPYPAWSWEAVQWAKGWRYAATDMQLLRQIVLDRASIRE